MKRRIIKIDKEKCNGCGVCAEACHEGAIEMADGKATLTREDYCDGLGDCLPACPVGAISFEEREAPAYDEAAALAAKTKRAASTCRGSHCPGTQSRALRHESTAPQFTCPTAALSHLAQWPCQIKLVPTSAPYLEGADLLIAADCTAYAYGGFHKDLMRNRITLIGCPKLDACDYSDKLTEIIKNNDVRSVKIARIEVPCCQGLENAAKRAIQQSGKFIPWQVVTVTTDGKILE